MSTPLPTDKLKDYPSELIEQIITGRAPIHTYNNTIPIRKPFIRFIFFDIESIPTLTQLPLNKPGPCTFFHDIAPRRPELHALHEGYWVPSYNSEKLLIQSFNLNTNDSSIETTTIPSVQRIALDVMFDPNDQRDIPTSQLVSLEALTSHIEEEISTTGQKVSLDFTFDSNDQRDQPIIQLHKPDARTGSTERSISLTERHVSFDATLNPKDQREIPVVQFRALDAQTSSVEKPISCTTLRPSLAGTFNPADQREKLTLQSLKQDVRASSVEKTISIVEQKASLDVVFDHDKKHEETSTIPYILCSRSAQYTHAITREEQQYDSYNNSLAIMEPRCYDYPVSKTRTKSRIVRYHRYIRTNHIVSNQYKAETSSGNHQHPDHTSIEDK